MQTIPAISVAPQPAPAPAESPAAGDNVNNDHFSRHLSDARHRADRKKHDAKTAADDTKRRKPQTATEEKHAQGPPKSTEDTKKTTTTDHTNSTNDEVKADDTATVNDKNLLQHMLDSTPHHSSTGIGRGELLSTSSDATGILQTEATLSLQDKGTQQTQGGKTIIAAVLDKITGDQAAVAVDQNQNMEKASQQPGTQTEDMVVERWQAQFNYADSTIAASQKNTPSGQTKVEIAGMSLSSQTIQDSASPDAGQAAARAQGTSGNGVAINQPPQDTNSSYIHSNLPGVTTVTNTDAHSANEQQTGQTDQNAAKNAALANGTQAPITQTGQEPPLLFSLDQSGTVNTTPLSGLATSSSTSLQLPSGIAVPHSQIIDQVAGQFSMNRTLESGTITLRLHPAELGELRMEIKVKQDNIKAHITTQNPQVQDILDRNLPRLRQALEQQGMNLAHMQVSVTADDGSNGQFFQEQFNRQQFGHSSHTNSSLGTFSLPEEEIDDEPYVTNSNQNLSVHI